MAFDPSKPIELFEVAGIRVDIDYSWLAVFVLVLWSLSAGYFPQTYPGHPAFQYWIVGFAATLLFFTSVLIHELSHATVGNMLGEKIDRITLFIFGGMAHLSGEPRNANDELKIAAVGPLSSLVLALAFWLAQQAFVLESATSLWTALFSYLAFINLALALFNLLPGYPLDGGRLLRAALWKRWGNLQTATAHAADWGRNIAWALMGLGAVEIFSGALVGGLWLIFIGLFLRAAAAGGYQSTMMDQTLRRVRVGDIMTREPVTLAADLPVADAIEHYFLRLGYGGFPVVADGRVVGMLSLSQLRHCPSEERARRTVAEIMIPLDPRIEIEPEASAIGAIHKMNEANSRRLLVLDGGKLVGIITLTGLTRFVQIKRELSAESAAD